MIHSSRNHATVTFDAGTRLQRAAHASHLGKRILKSWPRAMLAALTMSLALSGCGVFCGGAGGSGGGFAGGCATGMRF
jgi:hypothetical protein